MSEKYFSIFIKYDTKYYSDVFNTREIKIQDHVYL